MILKIWPLCERSLTFILFSPLSWQRNIVWIPCYWLFYSLWLEEEFEIYFNLIGSIFKFYPHITFDLGFHGQYDVWKIASMFIWKFWPSSAFWSMNFQILITWEQVYRIPYSISSMGVLFASRHLDTIHAETGFNLLYQKMYEKPLSCLWSYT